MSPPPPPSSPPKGSRRDLTPTPIPAPTAVLVHRPHPANTSDPTLGFTSAINSIPAPQPLPSHMLPRSPDSARSAFYASKAGAAINCSYRPKSPGIETPEETRKRLEYGNTPLSGEKKAEIREMQRQYLENDWAFRRVMEREGRAKEEVMDTSTSGCEAGEEEESESEQAPRRRSMSHESFVLVDRDEVEEDK